MNACIIIRSLLGNPSVKRRKINLLFCFLGLSQKRLKRFKSENNKYILRRLTEGLLYMVWDKIVVSASRTLNTKCSENILFSLLNDLNSSPLSDMDTILWILDC